MIGAKEVKPVRIVDVFKSPTLRVVEGGPNLSATGESTEVVGSGSDVPVYFGRNVTGGSGDRLRFLTLLLGPYAFYELFQ